MITIPQAILQRFELLLEQDKIPANRHNFFKKRLRYYLDFCHKYEHDPQNIDSLSLFINKLRIKKQSWWLNMRYLPLHRIRYLMPCWFETAAMLFLYSLGAIKAMADAVGIEKFLFGTDYPLLAPSRYKKELGKTGLNKNEINMLFFKNAENFIKLLGW